MLAANRMLGRSSGNHDWLLANASDCVWMETGLKSEDERLTWCNYLMRDFCMFQSTDIAQSVVCYLARPAIVDYDVVT